MGVSMSVLRGAFELPKAREADAFAALMSCPGLSRDVRTLGREHAARDLGEILWANGWTARDAAPVDAWLVEFEGEKWSRTDLPLILALAPFLNDSEICLAFESSDFMEWRVRSGRLYVVPCEIEPQESRAREITAENVND